MSINIGFIGTGNMGSALALAAAKSNNCIFLYDKDSSKATVCAEKCGGKALESVDEIIKTCEYVFLGVKPQVLPSLLKEISDKALQKTKRTVFVTMAAGVKIETVSAALGDDIPVIRIMPNLPVMIEQGVVLVCNNKNVTEEDISTFEAYMSHSGRIIKIEEKNIDAASAVSGCGPAFAYMFTEALADGAVNCGLPAALATELAAQTILGSAQMVLSSNSHPGKLKADVCSPGGTTIEGVRALEEHNFRAACMDAVIAAYKRTKELS